jgi:hypothetical protein
MFIGQGLSLDARRAAQAERRAANAAVVAPPAAEWPSSAAPAPPAPLAGHPVSLLDTATGAASLSIAAPSAAVAAATTAAPRLPAVRRAAQPDDPVPGKFPGEKGIMRPNMIPFVLVIFSLVDTIGPHGGVGEEWDDDQTKWDAGYGTSTTTRNNHQMIKRRWGRGIDRAFNLTIKKS